jgi:Flp pilus assembly protein TadG
MNAIVDLQQPHFPNGAPVNETPKPAAGSPKVEKVCRLCRKNRRGAAVVEFAIVAPVFFLLVFGMIEYGRLVMVQQILTNASREGARFAVIEGHTESDAAEVVENYLTSASINGTPTVDVTPGGSGSNQTVTVSVSIPFGQVSWLPSPMFVSSTMPLTAVSVMRREGTN